MIVHACTDLYILHTLAFVARLSAEELPHQMKKYIETGLQDWEKNLCKVTVFSLITVLIAIAATWIWAFTLVYMLHLLHRTLYSVILLSMHAYTHSSVCFADSLIPVR